MNKGKKSRKPRKTSGKSEKEQLEAADEMVDNVKSDMVQNLKLHIERLEKELAGWRTKKC